MLCAGNGEHLIQPFLDRLAERAEEDEEVWAVDEEDSFSANTRCCVDCSLDDAVDLVVSSFRAAAERDVTLGDGLHLWIIRPGQPLEKRFYSLPLH